MALKLQTIICSTRPGRIGPSISQWFHDLAGKQSEFDCELVDLADFNLPVYDEPKHPSTQDYKHDHTKKWSEQVAKADAYVFVIPEYNYNPPGSFINALDYVYKEWNYKPCGFVSYGGASGGIRSAQVAKQLVTTLKMMPIPEGVMVQMAWKLINEAKQFSAQDHHTDSGKTMLKELAKWAEAMQSMR